MGQAPKGSSYNDSAVGWPLVAGAGDFEGHVPKPSKYTTQPTKLSESGDILLGIRASIGARAFADGEVCLGRGVAALRPGPELDRRFLWHWLGTSSRDLAAKGRGATFKQVNRRDIAELEIELPSLSEQRRIARILDATDVLTKKRREAVAATASLSASGFVHRFGDPVINDQGWPTASLSEITTKIGSGATPRGGAEVYKLQGVPLVRSMNVHDGRFVDKGLAFLDDKRAAKLVNVTIQAGDVLVNITGASIARVCRAPASMSHARVNQHVAIVRPNGAVEPRFIERLLLSPPMKRHLLRLGGSGATRQALTKAQLGDLRIVLPPEELRQEFVASLSTTERLAGIQETYLNHLDELFASLQSRAFAGGL